MKNLKFNIQLRNTDDQKLENLRSYPLVYTITILQLELNTVKTMMLTNRISSVSNHMMHAKNTQKSRKQIA